MTTLPSAGPLAGRWVRLDLLGEPDLDEMYPILADPAVYAHGYVMHHRPGSVADARDLGPAGTLAGTTSLSEADLRNESIHIGSTLYGSRWWGTQVNPEAKLLLMAHCFEDCGYGRIKIQTDVLNTRSQAAIEKLGVQREGVMRRHLKREDGTFRDTVVYSVPIGEWPAVKSRLLARLAR